MAIALRQRKASVIWLARPAPQGSRKRPRLRPLATPWPDG